MNRSHLRYTAPWTPPRQHQQRESTGITYYSGSPQSQTAYTSSRFSLPAAPIYRDPPTGITSSSPRRQSTVTSSVPHYVTPTRSRHNGHPGLATQRPVIVNPEQWESLREKGYVLRGIGSSAPVMAGSAPHLASISSQYSHTSSSVGSRSSSSPSSQVRRDTTSHPPFEVHPSLRTGYHPSSRTTFNQPVNHFMKRPSVTIAQHQPCPPAREVHWQQPSINDNNTPRQPLQSRLHQMSQGTDPFILDARPPTINTFAVNPDYKHSVVTKPQYPSKPTQIIRQRSRIRHTPLHFNQPYQRQSNNGPSKQTIFSRPVSPILGHAKGGLLRASTLRRQETDASCYSQATLPEVYAPACNEMDRHSSPLMLSDWKPLALEKAPSQEAGNLWLDLERALLGTPPIGSAHALSALDSEGPASTNPETDDAPSVDLAETVYDFTECQERTPGASDARINESKQLSVSRPPLKRRDHSEDRLEHHRSLANSIIEKAQNSAAGSAGTVGNKYSQDVAAKKAERRVAHFSDSPPVEINQVAEVQATLTPKVRFVAPLPVQKGSALAMNAIQTRPTPTPSAIKPTPTRVIKMTRSPRALQTKPSLANTVRQVSRIPRPSSTLTGSKLCSQRRQLSAVI